MPRICINPGHGGKDPGAVGNGLKEKDITLYLSLKVADILKNDYQNVDVLLTRTGDETESLAQIVQKSNNWKADFFVSIHVNAGGGTGFESYVLPGAYASTRTKQAIIHDTIMAYLKQYGKRDRGKKTANFYVLKNTVASAVLIECLFIDNKNDAVLLQQTAFLNGLADAIARGIAKAMGLKAKPKPAPAPVVQLPKIAKQIAVRVNGKPVSAVGYLINNTTYLQGLFVAGLFGGKVEGHGDYVDIKTK